MPQLIYRPVQPDEAGELLTLQRAAFVTEARVYGTVEIPPLAETLEEIQRELETTTTVGAYLGGRLIETARLTLEGDVGWISRVAVAPDQQGKGIGSRLLEAVESVAPSVVARFQLGAGSRSSTNIAMYERRGYTEISRMLDSAGIELIIMGKDR